ncbi:MAG TPA: patatin-like phospholipase family protein [Gammaproteobacteria bacterium]
MKKELRLGFAMGGGVSLGAYSGAALTEAIKLAILRGNYERVVIDVFSGASAGAMSLLLMLRALIAPDPEQLARAEQNLHELFGDEFERIPRTSQKRAQLVAAQHAQDLQCRAWVDGVSVDKLLGLDGDVPPLEQSAGILSRAAIENLARRLIDFDGLLEINRTGLLAPRVAFACALTNLTAVVHDGRLHPVKVSDGGGRQAALLDALTSNCHREVRVFDLWLTPDYDPVAAGEKVPERWFRLRNGTRKKDCFGDLRRRSAWSTLGATCVAAGAFPFAFEPVVLKRRQYEYGETLWKQFANRIPEARRTPPPPEIWMTYVDGGALNNEPIREAFRLASLIDSEAAEQDFDRRIVFVDPRLAESRVSLNVPVHARYTDDSGLLRARGSLARLVPHAGNLASVFIDEASRNEADKISATRSLFEQRDTARAVLIKALHTANADGTANVETSLFKKLIAQCEAMLKANRNGVTFPPGQLGLEGEMRRVIREEGGAFAELEPQVETFEENCATIGQRHLWLRVLVFVYLDLLMDVGGKRRLHLPIAIAPTRVNSSGVVESDPLPGHEIVGFAGFASEASRHHQVEMARFHAERELRADRVIGKAPQEVECPPWTDAQQQAYIEEANRNLAKLASRADTMLAKYIDGWIKSFAIRKFLRAKLREALTIRPARQRIELRIAVPGEGFVLRRTKWRRWHRKPEVINGRHYLVACLDVEKDKHEQWRWQGANVEGEKQQRVTVHKGNGFLATGAWCRIELPSHEQVLALGDLAYPHFFIDLADAEIPDGGVVGAEHWNKETFQPGSLEDSLLCGCNDEPGDADAGTAANAIPAREPAGVT